MNTLHPIAFEKITIEGEMAVRAGLSMARLEGKWYRPDEVFTADTHGWPGDWEGRIILALALLGQATHREPAYLDEIIESIPRHLNEKGYLGNILPHGVSDEQQLAGHSWFVRGLIEYYNWKKDARVLPVIESVVRNLLLEAKGNYKNYPTDPETRFQDPHWVLSRLQTKTKAHAETSDCGCAFIPLDGVTAAYEFLRWPELKELAEEMIERFRTIDFVGLKVQTHATLSGIRGIIRMSVLEGNPGYLELAKEFYAHYKAEAWTEAFGNYNWFDHPRWTEPCGIIDSFMIATQLWQLTGESAYLTDAHYIYYNALSHGHRANGSFGTDRCVGAIKAEANEFLTPINFETYWCCSMRGGEGFSRAIEYTYFLTGNNVFVPFFTKNQATWDFDAGTMKVRQKTHYPYQGLVEISVEESSLTGEVGLHLYAPSFGSPAPRVVVNGVEQAANVTDGFVTVTRQFAAGDKVEIDLQLKPYTRDLDNSKNSIPHAFKFMFGPMVLGIKPPAVKGQAEEDISEEGADRKLIDFDYLIPEPKAIPRDAELVEVGAGQFEVKGTGVLLAALCDVKDLTREDSMEQIVFKSDCGCSAGV
ncbi:MAG: hypothetical protein WCH98_18970 [Verrucomicrobiota bacterium]